MGIVKLDCKGHPCPQPVLQTKEALEQGAGKIEVLVDNVASRENVARFAQSRNCDVAIQDLANGCYLLTLDAVKASESQDFDSSEYDCTVPAGGGIVYVIASDSMGRGSDELGWALLQTYIQTLERVEPLPSKILFYNAGVKLLAEGSGALDALQKLQQRGVDLLACGTCLDFFKLKSAVQVGSISNMYEIMTSMSEADKVLSPF